MSNRASNWAWSVRGLSPGEKIVLVLLADYCDENDSCFPGVDHIAEQCEISSRSVIRHIQKLQRAGLIAVERRATENGSRTSNRYFLAVHNAHVSGSDNLAPRSVIADQNADDLGSDNLAPRSVDQVTNPVDQVTTVSLTRDPSDRSFNPPTPAERGSRTPSLEVLAAGGSAAVTAETRQCRSHRRQRGSCLECWTAKPAEIPWCGHCDQGTRHRQLTPTTVERCPECHWLVVWAREAELVTS